MRWICALLAVAGLGCLLGLADDSPGTTARGVVFHDANRNAQRDPGEDGIAGIRVSNGRDIVRTDEQGAYELPVDDETIIFVIKPRDWMTPVDRLNLPRCYYIHKPGGSPKLKYGGVPPTGPLPESIDFPLYRRPEPDRFKVLVFGDSQPYQIEHVDYLAHDIVEQVAGTDAAFCFSLGDVVGDRLDLYDPVTRAMAHIGVPIHNIQGNHDMDYESLDDEHADDVFERVFGPPYYSFDYGPVHFIVLEDVVWHGKDTKKNGDYHAGLGRKQLEFVRNDLKLLDRDQLVVLTMHIPIIEIAERRQLFSLLAEHPHTVSFSAHLHFQQHWFLDAGAGWPGSEPHHHITFVTACGSWWRGELDEVGIPHTTMRDGTPNGWGIATFDGHQYSIAFQAARRPADYQMNIYTPNSILVSQAGQTEVLVNVFAGSQRSVVEMRFAGGDWTRLEQVYRPDPYYAALKKAEQENPNASRRKLPQVVGCPHLWRGTLPPDPAPGTHLIEVRTTDVFGQTYTGRRLIRIESAAARL